MIRNFLSLLLCVGMAGLMLSPSADAGELGTLVEEALARSGAAQGARALVAARQASVAASSRLTKGAPAADIGILTDQVGSQDGYREQEFGVSVPLWLPGEGRATRRLSAANLVAAQGEAALSALSVAQAVRTAYWDLAQADARVVAEQQRHALAHDTATATARSVAARESAPNDQALAEALEAEAAARLAEAQAAQKQAALTLEVLTGVKTIASEPEVPVALEAIPQMHPEQQMLEARVKAAEAQETLARIQRFDNPEAGLVYQRERGSQFEDYNDRFGFRVKIPLWSSPAAKAERLEKAAQAQAARLEQEQGKHALQATLTVAQLQLETARQAVDQAEIKKARLATVRRNSEIAYKEGQLSFLELLRARDAALDADLGFSLARLAQARAVSLYNQAAGVLP